MLKVFKTVIEVITATYVGIVIVGTIYELGKDAGKKESIDNLNNSTDEMTDDEIDHIIFNGRRYDAVN